MRTSILINTDGGFDDEGNGDCMRPGRLVSIIHQDELTIRRYEGELLIAGTSLQSRRPERE